MSVLHVIADNHLCVCSVLELDDNEAAISLCLVHFSSMPEDELLLAVGTVQGLTFNPRQVDGEDLSSLVVLVQPEQGDHVTRGYVKQVLHSSLIFQHRARLQIS